MTDFLETDSGSRYVLSPRELPEGWYAIQSTTTLDFYVMKGKTTKLTKDNLTPRFGSYYLIADSPTEPTKYYLREFRTSTTYKDVLLRNTRYIKDGALWVLYTEEEVEEMRQTLSRLYKSYHKKEGKLDYQNQYLPLLRAHIWLDNFTRNHKHDPSYMVTIKRTEEAIRKLWG